MSGGYYGRGYYGRGHSRYYGGYDACVPNPYNQWGYPSYSPYSWPYMC